MSSHGDSAKLKITNAKLHFPIVTLFTKDNVVLIKQLSKGFRRSVYWNSYQTKPEKVIYKGKNIYELLNPSFLGVKRLFALAYFIAAGADADEEAGIKDNRKCLLPRGKINNYNVLIDGINIYDQPINDVIKQSDEVEKFQQDKVMIVQQAVC